MNFVNKNVTFAFYIDEGKTEIVKILGNLFEETPSFNTVFFR